MTEKRLKRELGLLQTTMLGIGGAICAGVFVTLGYAATLAGTGLIIAMVLCGIINLFTMLSYAELGAAIPSAGGEYTFSKAAFGGFFSFATGWFEWISNMFYAAFSAVGFAYLLSYVIPQINVPLTAIITIAIFTAINVKGVSETGRTQTILVIILLGILGAFIAAGLWAGSGEGTSAVVTPQGFLGVLRASAFIFVVYLGGEAIAVAQAEIKNPGKTIPRAILLSCLALIVIYTLVTIVVFRVVSPSELAGKESPLAYVAERLTESMGLGSIGIGIITFAGITAALSSVNTSTMAHSRVAYALARDGYFPKRLFSVHGRFRTPHVAIILGAALTAAFAATGIVNFVAYATDFGFMIGFVFVNLSLIKLRRDKPNLARPFKVPLYPLTPLLGIATSLMLIFFLDAGTLFMGAQLFIFGLLAYYVRMISYEVGFSAIAGMNFGVSGFSAILGYLVVSDSLPVALTLETKWLVFAFAVIVSVSYLVAGLLFTTRRRKTRDE
ncbi:amino acid permease [Candidatus Bathyarchaeota archaeon]|nr:amino acid permease [Candidatus Bathyarchaeota archaeon]